MIVQVGFAQRAATAWRWHEAGPIALAAQLCVLCQQRGIDAGNGIIDRLLHTGLSLFLAPSGGALAERFRREADAHVEYFAPFGVDTSRSEYRTGYVTDQLVVAAGGRLTRQGNSCLYLNPTIWSDNLVSMTRITRRPK